MRTKIVRFLPLLAALALCGCNSVTSKTIVGSKAAVLDPKVWNGKWRNADGSAIATRVKDAKLGIIELKTFQPWTKLAPGEMETADVYLRTLGPEVVANEQQGAGGGYGFERVAVNGDYLVTFDADEHVFAGLIKRHKIKGTLERDKNGRLTGSCTIEGFSERDYQRLQKEEFDVKSLFGENPAKVFVRGHGLW